MKDRDTALEAMLAELAEITRRLRTLQTRVNKIEDKMRYPPLGVFMTMTQGGSDEPETV